MVRAWFPDRRVRGRLRHQSDVEPGIGHPSRTRAAIRASQRNSRSRRRVQPGMRAPRSVIALSLAGLLLGACSTTDPSASTHPLPEPIEAVATHDGVQVGLGVSQARVPPGGEVAATVVVRNGAPGAVTWQGGGCELQGQFTVTPLGQAAPAPAGQAWPGDKGVIKKLALPEATAIRIPVPADWAHNDDDGVAFGCDASLAFNELLPGAETRATVVWVASTAGGVPVPAGDYEVAVTFPYIGRGLAGPPLDFAFEEDLTPVTARLVITVDPGPALPPAAAAMDAILGDPAFTAALEQHPRQIWESTSMRWVDGAWVVRVRYQPGGLLEGRLDPASGAVIVSDGLAGDR